MDADSGFLYLPMNEGDGSFTLQDPCLLDCPTEGELITFTIDRANPQYLFVSIGGEMRRCFDLSPLNLSFETREEAIAYLESLRDSDFFNKIVREEQSLNRNWDSL